MQRTDWNDESTWYAAANGLRRVVLQSGGGTGFTDWARSTARTGVWSA
ncbi:MULTISPECIES: hypothetical protein [unclassified Nonomuraea]|nr:MULTISPECIES: hypothetical protein [unclassified Nonomuraea]NBE94880.1 hypothetical protein [Nonomuraea sp. K271]